MSPDRVRPEGPGNRERIAAAAAGESHAGGRPRGPAALAYASAFFGASLLVGPVLFLLNRHNGFLRFHAAQATALTVVVPAVGVALVAAGVAVGGAFGGGTAALVALVPAGASVLAGDGLFAYLAVTAYEERVVVVPVVGRVALLVAR